jgi:hypothetical protein
MTTEAITPLRQRMIDSLAAYTLLDNLDRAVTILAGCRRNLACHWTLVDTGIDFFRTNSGTNSAGVLRLFPAMICQALDLWAQHVLAICAASPK